MGDLQTAGVPDNIQVIALPCDSYTLTAEQIKHHGMAAHLAGKRWSRPLIRFEAYKNGWLTLLNTYNRISYKIALKFEENKLYVHCGCENTSYGLCHHAYHGLLELIYLKGEDFLKTLVPGGLMDLAFNYPKLFEWHDGLAGIEIYPQKALGHVFGVSQGTITGIQLQQLTDHQNAIIKPSDKVTCYLVVWPVRRGFLPFVTPCTGTLTIDRRALKSFDKPLTGLQQTSRLLLTEDQQTLNKKAFELCKVAENMTDALYRSSDSSIEQLTTYFTLWKTLFRLLREQDHVSLYQVYRPRQLKKIPYKNHLDKIELGREGVKLSFSLTDKGSFYQLRMQMQINNSLVKNQQVAGFLVYEDSKVYLFDDLLDAVLAEWFSLSNGVITIFKEHFRKFEQEILHVIKARYPVKIVANRKKNAHE